MALFSQYAMAAATEALDDAGWKPTKEEDLEATVWNSFNGVKYVAKTVNSGSIHRIWNR
jgi:3-oxoacyl-[acyl-carrier-protein] synthase II